jgi:hypothetical protein
MSELVGFGRIWSEERISRTGEGIEIRITIKITSEGGPPSPGYLAVTS